MMLLMLVFWGVMIIAIALAIRWAVSQGREWCPTDAALDVLRQRYARGDIGEEEFETKKKELT
jgi:putative membrane protein